jgi:hypothetical protein
MDFFEDLKNFKMENNSDDYEPMKNVGLVFKGWKSGEMSDEHRKNLSIAASKRVRTADHIEKLHQGRKNSKNSTSHTNAVVASRIGTKHTQESKLNMSKAKKGKHSTILAASKAGKISAAKRADDPMYRQIQSEKMKIVWAKRKEGIVNGD